MSLHNPTIIQLLRIMLLVMIKFHPRSMSFLPWPRTIAAANFTGVFCQPSFLLVPKNRSRAESTSLTVEVNNDDHPKTTEIISTPRHAKKRVEHHHHHHLTVNTTKDREEISLIMITTSSRNANPPNINTNSNPEIANPVMAHAPFGAATIVPLYHP